MKLLFLGDVMGRAGRAAIAERLPKLRAEWGLDFVVVNGENASSGMGLTAEHAKLLLEAGADVVTLGDHAFDQKDMIRAIDSESRIIRPLNFAKEAPGRGARLYEDRRGRKVLVAQVLGQVFMKRAFDDPFSAVDAVLRAHPLGGLAQAILLDVHCEATSEKMAMGHWCDGRASVGLDPVTGVGWAGGFVGDGVGTSNLAGRTLAALITGVQDDPLLDLPWVNHRSPLWEPEPLRWAAATVGLKATESAVRVESRTGKPSLRGRLVDAITGH